MNNPIGNAGALNVKQSLIPGAIMMPQDQHYFVKEQSFTQSQRYSFGSDETKYFLLDPTAYVPGPTQEFGRVVLEVPSFFAAAGPIEINFYDLVTLAPAVATPLTVPSFNRIADSAISPQLVLSSLNVPPGASTLFSEILVPSNAVGAGQAIGFSVSEALPFQMDLTKKLVMSAHNLNGADTLVGIRFNWFEI